MTSEPLLRTVALSKRFGSLVAVDGLDLEVRKGEILGFLGPNGAGKTTSIAMMAGLLRPSAGEVRIAGEPVGPDHPASRRLVGLCPQENVLYPDLTASENLEYAGALLKVPPRERRERALRLLDELGLADKARTRASALSGGMKRRLTLAAALIHDPPLVILDEPEAGLDPHTRLAVREFVRGLKRERTVVLTSHNMDEVERVADRVAILDRGRLRLVGAPEELKARHGGGDAMEIVVAEGAAERVRKALEGAVPGEVRREGDALVLRGHDLPPRFPEILERVRAAGASVRDVRYRGNTLEDVFLAVTGRGLRE